MFKIYIFKKLITGTFNTFYINVFLNMFSFQKKEVYSFIFYFMVYLIFFF